MGAVFRAVKSVRILLMLVVLVVMLWTYAYLPESVSLQQGNAERHLNAFTWTWTKGQLFYTFLLVFASVNVVLMLYFNILSRGASRDVHILFGRRRRRSMPLVLWIGFMHIIVQLFLLSGWMHVSLSNIEGAILYRGNTLLIIGLALLILGIVLLPLLFWLIPADAET